MMQQGWHMLWALKHTYDLFFEKDLYWSISFGNVYIGYTYCCYWPSIYFVWLNFIWLFTLLEFEVQGYYNMENFLKTILKLIIETTHYSSFNYVL